MFIHDALEELITCGDTSIGAPSMRDAINSLNRVDPESATTGFEDQFKVSGSRECLYVAVPV